jgi:hypothetical protein
MVPLSYSDKLGFSAIVAGLLYGLQLLIRDTDFDNGKQMEHRRNLRRAGAQQRIFDIKQATIENRPLLAPNLAHMEAAVREIVARDAIRAEYPVSDFVRPLAHSQDPESISIRPLAGFDNRRNPRLEETRQALVTQTRTDLILKV